MHLFFQTAVFCRQKNGVSQSPPQRRKTLESYAQFAIFESITNQTFIRVYRRIHASSPLTLFRQKYRPGLWLNVGFTAVEIAGAVLTNTLATSPMRSTIWAIR
jgi:hypothetical protein